MFCIFSSLYIRANALKGKEERKETLKSGTVVSAGGFNSRDSSAFHEIRLSEPVTKRGRSAHLTAYPLTRGERR